MTSVYRRLWVLLCLSLLLLVGGQSAAAAPALPWPVVTAGKSVSPGSTDTYGTVTYTITLQNSGDVAAQGVSVVDTLPDGFSYQWGSSSVYLDGVLISSSDPSVSGRILTWSDLGISAQRSGSFYGIHTFVQDRCENWYIDWQLDRALDLMGPGAWVKQLFPGINTLTQGPHNCWIYFVNGAYDRGLKPVLRLQGEHAGSYWHKPYADWPGHYGSIANAFQRVVNGLPRRDGHQLYVEIWNEPNLNLEWSRAANPVEYGQFLEQTAAAIRALGDSRISILNGGLSPGGQIDPLTFIDQMVGSVPNSLWAWDLWSTHPYPGNHPPEYNIHQGSATHPELTIDSYLRELQRLADWGRPYVKVVLTETGYDLWNSSCAWEGYASINESNRADYVTRAFRDYWATWPEVVGVCPYQLSDPWGSWAQWDWIAPSGQRHEQYPAVASMGKSYPDNPSSLVITFRATAAGYGGTFTNDIVATANNTTISPLSGAAPVVVIPPASTPTLTPTPAESPTATPTPTLTPLTVTTIPAGMRPHGIAVDSLHNLIYVANHDGGNVSVIDGNLNWITQTVHLGGSWGSNGIAFDPAQRRLYVANKTTNDLAAVPAAGGPAVSIAVGHQPDGVDIAPGLGIVYVANFGSGTLSLVNGPANTTLVTSPADGEPSMVVRHPLTNRVYVTNHQAHTVTIYDGSNGSRLKSVPVDGGPYGIALDPVRGRLYTANREGRSVTVLDTTSDTVIDRIPMDCTPYIVAANPNTGHIFPVCTETQQLHIYDGDTLRWLAVLPVGKGAGEGIAVNPATNLIYVANSTDNTITVIHDAGPVSVPTPLPTPTGAPTLTSAPTPTITPMPHILYLPLVTHGGGAASVARPAGRVERLPAGAEGPVHSLLVHPHTGWLYSASDGVLTISDPAGSALLARVAIGLQPQGMALDPAAGRLYLSSWGEGSVVLLDARSGKRQAEAGGLRRPSGLAVANGKLYVAETAADRLLVLDGRTLERLGEIKLALAPYTLAASADGRRVYVALAGSGKVALVDTSRDRLSALAPLDGLGLPQDIAVDTRTGQVYVLYLLTPRYRNVAVLDGQDGRRIATIAADLEHPLDGAQALTLDAARRRLYVSDASGLQVFSMTTAKWLERLPAAGPANPFGLAVNPQRGQVYGALAGSHGRLTVFP